MRPLSVVLAVLAGALVLFGLHRWRLRVLRDLQADLMRLVRERTEQLEEANRKLALISYVDAVTGVANRRSFEEQLVMEWRRSARTQSQLSLLMVDIDRFKEFNDGFGHQAGDACLRTVADTVTMCIHRAGDTVARYGGEEFAVILPDTDSGGAATLAERIRAAIEQHEIPAPAQRARVTLSVGVATMTGSEAGEASGLVRAADAALYQAKKDGRNLVRVAESQVA